MCVAAHMDGAVVATPRSCTTSAERSSAARRSRSTSAARTRCRPGADRPVPREPHTVTKEPEAVGERLGVALTTDRTVGYGPLRRKAPST